MNEEAKNFVFEILVNDKHKFCTNNGLPNMSLNKTRYSKLESFKSELIFFEKITKYFSNNLENKNLAIKTNIKLPNKIEKMFTKKPT